MTWPPRTSTRPSFTTMSTFSRSSRFSSGRPSTTIDVGELARLQASELVVHVEEPGVGDRRGLQRIRNRVAALDEPLQLRDVHVRDRPAGATNRVRPDAHHHPGRAHLLEDVEVALGAHREPPRRRSVVPAGLIEDVLIHLQRRDRPGLVFHHLRDRLVGAGKRVLDGVHPSLHGHRGVDGLAVAGHLQPEPVRFVHRGRHFVGREVARDLDDARALLERLADRRPPGVGPVHLPGELRPMVGGDRTLRCVTARARDDVAAGEDARCGNRIGRTPVGQEIRRLAHAVHVANRREARLQVVAQVAFAAQHARPFTGMLVDRRVGVWIGQVDVHVDEAGHHRLARDVDHLGIRRPRLDAGRQDGLDDVAFDDDRRRRAPPLTASKTRPPRSTMTACGPAAGLSGIRRGSSVVRSLGARTPRRSCGSARVPEDRRPHENGHPHHGRAEPPGHQAAGRPLRTRRPSAFNRPSRG